MSAFRAFRAAAAAFLLATGVAASAAAQAPSAPAALTIRIVDTQQLPIPGASCTVTTPAGIVAGSAVSDGQGVAEVRDLPTGTYTIRIQLDGFDPVTRPAVAVHGGARLEIVLLISAMTQSVTVTGAAHDDTSMAAGSTPASGAVEGTTMKRLPLPATTVEDVLPVIPGVLRSGTGELSFKGSGNSQNGLLVNGVNAIDPGTGGFRLSLPVDSVKAVQVFLHPYVAEYGLFTGGLTRVETQPGGDHWHFELNDFLPDPRFVGGRVHGIAEDEPHLNMNGPIFGGAATLSQSLAYTIAKRPVRGLDFPDNETRSESVSSFTELALAPYHRHRVSLTAGFFPEQLDYVGLDVFMPRPATPSLTRQELSATARDDAEVPGGVLTSALSMHRFDVSVAGQATDDMVLTPTGVQGSYFATQHRESSRLELREVYALSTRHWFGAHDLKAGVDLNAVHSDLTVADRPVDIQRADGTLAERIEFDSAPPILASDREYVAFVQDRWSLGPHVTLDAGLRYENEQIADTMLVAPRAGFAWSPSSNGNTIVRGGVGIFYDEVPLNIRSFARYPTRTVTTYGTDGTVLARHRYRNVLVDAVEIKTFDPRKALEQTEFVPENLTWNLQVDRRFSPWLAVRTDVIRSHTSDLYVVDPEVTFSGHDVIVLKSTGRANFSSVELTARLGRGDRLVNVSYTRSHATGDLNQFSGMFGDLASPVVREDQESLVPTDAPNRLLAWGTVALPYHFSLAPLFEVRSGFPYSVIDETQSYVGTRNADGTRFPRFVALDMEIAKEVRVSAKHAVRLSLRAFNLTNHFNPRDVHANTADPLFGQFLASYRRYFTGGFDIVF